MVSSDHYEPAGRIISLCCRFGTPAPDPQQLSRRAELWITVIGENENNRNA